MDLFTELLQAYCRTPLYRDWVEVSWGLSSRSHLHWTDTTALALAGRPALLLAEHVYTPASCFVTPSIFIVRFLRKPGIACPSFSHEISGAGLPVALQNSSTAFVSLTVTFCGFVIIWGGTTKPDKNSLCNWANSWGVPITSILFSPCLHFWRSVCGPASYSAFWLTCNILGQNSTHWCNTLTVAASAARGL